MNVEQGWQDIASAPKDGSTFIGLGNNYGRPNAGRHLALVYWDEDRHLPGFYDRAESSDQFVYLTHWLPATIPALPEPGK